MTDNNLAAFRKKANLTQRQLAEACGVSQPTIQRAEADVGGNTSYLLMMQIANVLKVKMESIWPSTAMGMKESRSVDDISENTFKVKMAGISKPLCFPISAADSKRLFLCVQSTEGFAVFISGGETIALRLDKVQWSNFLWDIPYSYGDSEPEATHDLRVWFEGAQDFTDFSVHPDRLLPESDDENEGLLDHMVFLLDSFGEYYDFEPIHFMDGDGEDVWINPAQIVMLRLDRSIHDQDLMRVEREGEDEDEVGATD